MLGGIESPLGLVKSSKMTLGNLPTGGLTSALAGNLSSAINQGVAPDMLARSVPLIRLTDLRDGTPVLLNIDLVEAIVPYEHGGTSLWFRRSGLRLVKESFEEVSSLLGIT